MEHLDQTAQDPAPAQRADRAPLPLWLIALCGLLVHSSSCSGALAAEGPVVRTDPVPTRDIDRSQSLDDQLLRGLSGHTPPSVVPSGTARGNPHPTANGPSGGHAMSDGEATGKTVKRLTGDGAIREQDPLQLIGGRMREVERRLGARDVSTATQDTQRRIVAELDALIAQLSAGQSQSGTAAKSQQGKAGPGGKQMGKAGTKAARDSTNRLGQATHPETETAAMRRTLGELWGHLPERVRRQMQSGLSIEFLPQYRKLIEDYYKRLAEDRPERP